MAAVGLAEKVKYDEHLKDASQEPQPLPADLVPKEHGDPKNDIAHQHFPTEEERQTLRRVPEKLSWAIFSIGVCELAERFSFYGVTQVFTNYISRKRPFIDGELSSSGAAKHLSRPSGALGLGSETANGIVTFNQFWCYITPLLGAYLADVYVGRYYALCIGVALAMVGHILLVISAIPPVLDNSDGALACFIIAIIIMGLGTGCFKSNCSVLIIDQIKIKEQTVVPLKSGERVIVDPALTTERLYLWFYLMINIGSFCGQIGMVYAEKWIGFWLAFLLPTLVFIIPIPVLWIGRKIYTVAPPDGSVLKNAVRVCALAIRKNWSWNPKTFLRLWKSPHYWDCAKPSLVPEHDRKSWMTYDDQWVDQLSCGAKACFIFLLFPLYWVCYNQISNNLIIQGGQMDIGSTPNEIPGTLDPIFIIVFVFVFNLAVYPLLDRMRVPFTPIKRITVGFFTACAAMIFSAVLQHYIYAKNPCGNRVGDDIVINGIDCSGTNANITVWVQAGSYGLVALSEIFAAVTSLEVAVLLAPTNMRSIIMAVSLFTTAFASAINEAFNPLSKNPLFVANYTVFACLSFVGGILFYLMFMGIDRNQEELNLVLQHSAKNAQDNNDTSVTHADFPSDSHTDLHVEKPTSTTDFRTDKPTTSTEAHDDVRFTVEEGTSS